METSVVVIIALLTSQARTIVKELVVQQMAELAATVVKEWVLVVVKELAVTVVDELSMVHAATICTTDLSAQEAACTICLHVTSMAATAARWEVIVVQ